MGSVNKVILIGNVGADPETTTTTNGKTITKFKLATNHKSKQDTITEWHKIVTFDKLAEIASKYVSKGRVVCIEGRIQTREYQTKEGNKAYITEIIANELTLLDNNKSAQPNGQYQNAQEQGQQYQQRPQNQQQQRPQNQQQQRPQQQNQMPAFDDSNFDF